MAPREGQMAEGDSSNRHSDSGFNDVAPGRFKDIDKLPKSSNEWIKRKQDDDNIGPYWRIHNKLYDLTHFAEKHPGGKFWIMTTKGTDITEAFESSHINETAEKILPKYFVMDINTPRNSPYTFHEDGFYRTFKKKVCPILNKIGRGPTRQMLLMQDALMLMFVALAFASCSYSSYILAIISGIFLAQTIMCAHNFFHQRDNFRMYYFDLGLLTSHDWRVSHGLSHHLFTNTRYDLEVTALEPLLVFMPKPEKSFMQRYGAQIYEFLLLPVSFYFQAFERLSLLVTKQKSFRPENLLPLLELFVICCLATSVGTGVRLWMVIHAACSTWFAGIGILVAHHHPEIYHEGDTFRENPDWGLCQLDAVRDRTEVTGNLYLVSTTFGDHSLHHLLPTVDQSKLDALYPAFFETCHEFNIPFEFLSQWELARGMYQQLANNKPNPHPPGYKVKHSSNKKQKGE